MGNKELPAMFMWSRLGSVLHHNLLLSLTLLGVIFHWCYGYCYFDLNKPKIKGKYKKECTDHLDGSVHPVGSTWETKNCLRCACAHSYVACCSKFTYPIAYYSICEIKLDLASCTYKLYKKDDPTIPCKAG
ncbi:beta-microseminoprotein E1-like [Erythrolamprus reginae]|uniref:beta-microseminoprotein E1-like n=1 Tax=Erythrolamprus reginae TaxID=121349 RepID=UPI00396CD753